MRSFENQSVLITGAASGIGRATALAFAREGARLTLADIDEERGIALAAEINQGGQALFVRTDVTSDAQVAELVATAVSKWGRIDCAFNNAGLAEQPTEFAEQQELVFDRLFAVNVKGVWLCLKHEIAQFLKQGGGGAIVNTASGAGAVAFLLNGVYTATKHAVVGLTRAAAVEYAKKGLRINALLPGATETPMFKSFADGMPGIRERVIAAHPIERMADPSEMAGAVLFLCSPSASFIVGHSLLVDGGYTAW